MKSWAASLVVLALTGASATATDLFDPRLRGDRLVGAVGNAPSGDTLDIGSLRLHLAGIVAPPVRLDLGRRSAAFLRLQALNRTVSCTLTGERIAGRRLAACTLDGRDIARTMVREGLARDCPRYSRGRYAGDERAARDTGIAEIFPLPLFCGAPRR